MPPLRCGIFLLPRGKAFPLGGRWRGTRRMRGKCPEVAPSSVGCADSFPQRGGAIHTVSPQFSRYHWVAGGAGPAPTATKKVYLPPNGGRYTSLQIYIKFHQKPCFSISLRPISTPITDAIIRPRVQPEESPRQCRPAMFVSRLVSILTLLE